MKGEHVVFVAYDGMTLLDLVGPYEVISLWGDVDLVVAAPRAGVVYPDSVSLPVVASHAFDDIDGADLIVVPGGPNAQEIATQNVVYSWLRDVAPKAQTLFSVCTGAFLLGEAGLLHGRRATTHWAALSDLSKYGAVPVSARWVEDGPILSAAGVSAGIDAALALTARRRGEQFAMATQLMIEYDPQPPFNSGNPAAAGPAVMAGLVGDIGHVMQQRKSRPRLALRLDQSK